VWGSGEKVVHNSTKRSAELSKYYYYGYEEDSAQEALLGDLKAEDEFVDIVANVLSLEFLIPIRKKRAKALALKIYYSLRAK